MSDRLVGGRYLLSTRVGVGGMGHVWVATDQVLRRTVAVKEVLLPEGLSETELTELRLRTLREARTAARLSHPNVVRIYDVIYDDERPWIVMEYVPSQSLARVVIEQGPLTPEQAARIGIALADALAAAHKAGVLHRDVKPGNVLLADDGRVMLTDFGLATFDEVGAPLTQTGIVYGSPQFIAPERALDGTSSAAADMWSLGATIYAAVEGHSPYARSSSYATLAALATKPPDPVQRAGSLKPVLDGLLHRNPRHRLSPAEVHARLERIIATAGKPSRVIPRQRRSFDPDPDSVGAHADPLDDSGGRHHGGWPSEIVTYDERDDVRRESVLPRGSGRHASGSNSIRQWAASRRHKARWTTIALCALAVIVLGVVVVRHSFAGLGPDAAASPSPTVTVTAGIQPVPTQVGGPPGPPVGIYWLCRPTPGGTTTTVASVPPTKGSTPLPSGWAWYADRTGFRIGTPPGWRVTPPLDATTCFYDPGNTRVLGVNAWRVTTTDPVKALTDRESDLFQTGSLPRYIKVRIAEVPCPTRCAEWEFTYDGPIGQLHEVIHAAIDDAGNAYAISWSTTAYDWSQNEANYDLIVSSFAPDPS